MCVGMEIMEKLLKVTYRRLAPYHRIIIISV